jgi:glycine/D-amino acid oxidase-like deaminating enzyme
VTSTSAKRPDHVERSLADASPASFWLDRPERPAPFPALERDEDADLAIVGGGFTGLWAALQAVEDEPGRSVVLLEGKRISEGATGRNGGFADPSLTHGVVNGVHHFPDEVATLVDLGHRNFAELLASLERHGIDASYVGNGKLEVATAPHWVEDLREHFETLERFGERVTWLERDAARAEVASPTYEAAVNHHSGGGVVDPARLAWGLARAASGLGVRIYEGSPVLGLRRAGAAVELRTPTARVRARKVVIATNAFKSPLRRVRLATIPVWDYVLMTEPLSPERRAAIGWRNGQGVGDTGNHFHYYRLTDDDRILFGGYDAIYYYASGLHSGLEQRPETFADLADHFFETFPQLEGLRFTHTWGGPIATTTRFCMDTGCGMGGRVSWAFGYTGLGVAASRFGARVSLDWLDRPDSPNLRLRFVRRRPVPWPPEPLRYLGVQLTRHELARADRNEGRRGIWLNLLDRLGLGFDS